MGNQRKVPIDNEDVDRFVDEPHLPAIERCGLNFLYPPPSEVVPDAKIVEISCTAYIRELGTD